MQHIDTAQSDVKAGSAAQTLRVIHRRSLREIAVEEIRAAIGRGELKAGERLTELGLARQLGVAQTTIREALVELEHQGFVERCGPRQTRITKLTRRQINDIYVVRTRLEVLAVELLLGQNQVDLTEADKEFERMLEVAELQDHGGFFLTDLNFHRALWRATGNAALFDVLERLVPKLFAFGLIQHAHPDKEWLITTAQTHGKVLHLIRSRQAEAAKEVMEASLERAWMDDAELPE